MPASRTFVGEVATADGKSSTHATKMVAPPALLQCEGSATYLRFFCDGTALDPSASNLLVASASLSPEKTAGSS